MPSPFPGMDPYLEGSLWTSVHTQLGVEIQRQLMPLLRPRYIALTNERFVIAAADADDGGQQAGIYPDISVAAMKPGSDSAGGSTALDMPLPIVPVPLLPGDSDVPLDLQRAFSNVYDLAGYDLAVNYSEPPELPLSSADAAWAKARLKAWNAGK